MDQSLRKQIYKNMDLKETDELLDIWHEHNTNEWREEAFQIVKEILLQRLGDIPPVPKKRPDQELLEKIEKNIEKLKLKNALQECNRALTRFPDSAELYNLRGLIHDLWDDSDKALKNYRKALQLDPEHKDAKENLTALKEEVGESVQELQVEIKSPERDDFLEAIEEPEFTVFYSPELAQKYYRRALEYDENDDVENALKNYQKALHFDPSLDEAFENLATIEEMLEDVFYKTDFFEKLELALDLFYENQKEKSLAICNEIKESLPSISFAHNELGMVFEEIEELEEAQSLYEKACQFNPRLIAAFTNWQNVNERLEALMYELPPVDENDLIEFEENGEWSGLVEPLPGWVYNNQQAYFSQGTPGHRNLPGKSGLDPMDTYTERARVEGIIIRSLLQFRFRTHNPVYLFSMTVLGIIMSLPFLYVLPALIIGDLNIGGISLLNGIVGPFLLINVFLSLITKRPEDLEDDGSAFF